MSAHAPEQAGLAEADAAPVPGPAAQSRRPLVAGGFVGLWALVVGVAVVTALVMISWTLAPNAGGDSAAAWRASGLAWLAAHHVPLTISGQPLSLLPLGALLLPLLLTRRGGAWTGRLLPQPTVSEMAQIVGAAGLAYAAGGAGVAWLSSASDGSVPLAQASIVTGLVAMGGTGWGVAREGDLVARARRLVPESGWRTLIGALAAVAVLVSCGAVLTAVSLMTNFAAIGTSLAAFDAGPAGAAGLTALGALSLPNLVLWMTSLVAGPGFQIGSTGSLSAFGGDLGTLPAFPILAALPPARPSWAPFLLVLPILAGVLASRIRWGADLPTVSGTLLSSVGLAGVVAGLMAALMRLSGGALGSGALAWVGPLVLPVTAATVGLVCLGFLGEAAAQGLRLAWALHRSEQAASRGRVAEPGELDSRGPAGGEDESGPGPGPDPGAGAESGGAGRDADERPAQGAGRWDALAGPRRLAGRLGSAPSVVGSKLTGAGALAVAVIVGPPRSDQEATGEAAEAGEPAGGGKSQAPEPSAPASQDDLAVVTALPDADR